MSRLRKVALMNPEMFKGTLKQLGNKGRTILKGIEDYKFSLEQAARIVTNDQNLSQRLIEKKKELDKAAGQIYSIVFEIENIDITTEFQQQKQLVNKPDLKNQVNNMDGENPPIPNGPKGPNSPQQSNTTSIPSGGVPSFNDGNSTPPSKKVNEEVEEGEETKEKNKDEKNKEE